MCDIICFIFLYDYYVLSTPLYCNIFAIKFANIDFRFVLPFVTIHICSIVCALSMIVWTSSRSEKGLLLQCILIHIIFCAICIVQYVILPSTVNTKHIVGIVQIV